MSKVIQQVPFHLLGTNLLDPTSRPPALIKVGYCPLLAQSTLVSGCGNIADCLISSYPMIPVISRDAGREQRASKQMMRVRVEGRDSDEVIMMGRDSGCWDERSSSHTGASHADRIATDHGMLHMVDHGMALRRGTYAREFPRDTNSYSRISLGTALR
ncbi:hypothetical protein BGW80DRAFT_1444742 [Lactifluus volemus]|nr:hypothetical protein BGW80DRAFT_1444742 [Lactifluus volemus]